MGQYNIWQIFQWQSTSSLFPNSLSPKVASYIISLVPRHVHITFCIQSLLLICTTSFLPFPLQIHIHFQCVYLLAHKKCTVHVITLQNNYKQHNNTRQVLSTGKDTITTALKKQQKQVKSKKNGQNVSTKTNIKPNKSIGIGWIPA